MTQRFPKKGSLMFEIGFLDNLQRDYYIISCVKTVQFPIS